MSKNTETKKQNLINILIRTTYRPKYFDKCLKSVYNQNYDNFKIICCYDDERCLNYLEKYNEKIEYFFIDIENKHSYKYNLYMNFLLDKVEDGWIMFLDDDDKFVNSDSLKTINNYLHNDNNIIFWKVNIGNRIVIPNNLNNIVKGNISGIGFCFHSKFKNLTKWSSIKCGDFYFVDALLKKHNFNKIKVPILLTSVNHNLSGNNGAQTPYSFQDFIKYKGIKQIYISEKLSPIKDKILNTFGLKDYNNKDEICVFFGAYTQNDLSIIKDHINKKFVMFDGNDIKNYKLFDSVNFLSRTKLMKDYLRHFKIFSRLIEFKI